MDSPCHTGIIPDSFKKQQLLSEGQSEKFYSILQTSNLIIRDAGDHLVNDLYPKQSNSYKITSKSCLETPNLNYNLYTKISNHYNLNSQSTLDSMFQDSNSRLQNNFQLNMVIHDSMLPTAKSKVHQRKNPKTKSYCRNFKTQKILPVNMNHFDRQAPDCKVNTAKAQADSVTKKHIILSFGGNVKTLPLRLSHKQSIPNLTRTQKRKIQFSSLVGPRAHIEYKRTQREIDNLKPPSIYKKQKINQQYLYNKTCSIKRAVDRWLEDAFFIEDTTSHLSPCNFGHWTEEQRNDYIEMKRQSLIQAQCFPVSPPPKVDDYVYDPSIMKALTIEEDQELIQSFDYPVTPLGQLMYKNDIDDLKNFFSGIEDDGDEFFQASDVLMDVEEPQVLLLSESLSEIHIDLPWRTFGAMSDVQRAHFIELKKLELPLPYLKERYSPFQTSTKSFRPGFEAMEQELISCSNFSSFFDEASSLMTRVFDDHVNIEAQNEEESMFMSALKFMVKPFTYLFKAMKDLGASFIGKTVDWLIGIVGDQLWKRVKDAFSEALSFVLSYKFALVVLASLIIYLVARKVYQNVNISLNLTHTMMCWIFGFPPPVEDIAVEIGNFTTTAAFYHSDDHGEFKTNTYSEYRKAPPIDLQSGGVEIGSFFLMLSTFIFDEKKTKMDSLIRSFGLYNSSKNFVSDVVLNVPYYLNMIFFKITGRQSWLYHMIGTQIITLQQKLHEFVEEHKDWRIDIARDDTLSEEIEELWIQSMRIKERHTCQSSTHISAINHLVTTIHKTLDEMYQFSRSHRPSARTRPTPWCISLFSGPGQGKSHVMDNFSRHTYELLQERNPGWKDLKYPYSEGGMVFRKPKTTNFWDGYTGNFMICLTELFVMKDDRARALEAAEVIEMIDSTPHHVNMARIDDKASTYCISRLVMITTNFDDYKSGLGISDVKAFVDRLHLPIKLTRNKNLPKLKEGERYTREQFDEGWFFDVLHGPLYPGDTSVHYSPSVAPGRYTYSEILYISVLAIEALDKLQQASEKTPKITWKDIENTKDVRVMSGHRLEPSLGVVFKDINEKRKIYRQKHSALAQLDSNSVSNSIKESGIPEEIFKFIVVISNDAVNDNFDKYDDFILKFEENRNPAAPKHQKLKEHFYADRELHIRQVCLTLSPKQREAVEAFSVSLKARFCIAYSSMLVFEKPDFFEELEQQGFFWNFGVSLAVYCAYEFMFNVSGMVVTLYSRYPTGESRKVPIQEPMINHYRGVEHMDHYPEYIVAQMGRTNEPEKELSTVLDYQKKFVFKHLFVDEENLPSRFELSTAVKGRLFNSYSSNFFHKIMRIKKLDVILRDNIFEYDHDPFNALSELYQDYSDLSEQKDFSLTKMKAFMGRRLHPDKIGDINQFSYKRNLVLIYSFFNSVCSHEDFKDKINDVVRVRAFCNAFFLCCLLHTTECSYFDDFNAPITLTEIPFISYYINKASEKIARELQESKTFSLLKIGICATATVLTMRYLNNLWPFFREMQTDIEAQSDIKEQPQQQKKPVYYVKGRPIIMQGGDALVPEMGHPIINKIIANMRVFALRKDEVFKSYFVGTFIHGRTVLTFNHAFEFCTWDTIVIFQSGLVKETISIDRTFVTCRKVGDRDIRLIDFGVGTLPEFPSLKKHFRPKDHFHGCTGVKRIGPQIGKGANVLIHQLDKEVQVTKYWNDSQSYRGVQHLRVCYNMKVLGGKGSNGLCGYIYFTDDPALKDQFILGIHVGQGQDDSIVAQVCTEDLNSTQLIGPHGHVYHDKILAQCLMGLELKEWEEEAGLPLPHYSGTVLAKDQSYVPTDTGYVCSPIYDSLNKRGLVTQAPAAMNGFKNENGEFVHPHYVTFIKMGSTPTSRLTPKLGHLLSSVGEKFARSYFQPTRSIRRFTLEEVIFGIPGVLTPIDNDASVTYEFKKQGFTSCKQLWNNDTRWIHPKLIERYELVDSFIEKGFMLEAFAETCWKSELRPLDRVLKAETRMFFVVIKTIVLICRSYLADAMLDKKNHVTLCPGKIGINPHSTDWKFFCDWLESITGVYLVYDAKHYDLGMMYIITMFYWYHMCHMYQVSYDSEFAKKLWVICSMGASGTTIYKDQLYTWLYSVFSGGFMTGDFNSFAHWFMLRISYENVLRELPPEVSRSTFKWKHNIREGCYGDDGAMKVSNLVKSFWNLQTLSATLKELFGLTITSPDKKSFEERKWYDDISEVVFLGRRFRREEETVFAPLEEESIYGMLSWLKKPTRERSIQMQLKDNIKTALREFIHHGQDKFDAFGKLLREVYRENKLIFCYGTEFKNYREVFVHSYYDYPIQLSFSTIQAQMNDNPVDGSSLTGIVPDATVKKVFAEFNLAEPTLDLKHESTPHSTPQTVDRRILEREYKLASIVQALGTSGSSISNPVSDWLSRPQVWNIVRNYTGFRYKEIRVRFQTITTPQQYGAVKVTWFPYGSTLNAAVTLEAFFARWCTILDVTQQNAVEFSIPWVYRQNWIMTRSVDSGKFFSEGVPSIAYDPQLTDRIETASESSFIVEVYYSFVGLEMNGPKIYEDGDTTYVKAPPIQAQMDNVYNALWSFGATYAASAGTRAAGRLGSYIEGEVETYVGEAANDFIFGSQSGKEKNSTAVDVPGNSVTNTTAIEDVPQAVRQDVVGDMATLQPNKGASVLTMDNHFRFIPPRRFADPEARHDFLKFIQTPVNMQSHIMVENAVFRFVAHPWLNVNHSNSEVNVGYLPYMAQFFQWWRGSIKFLLTFHTSPFYSARIFIAQSTGIPNTTWRPESISDIDGQLPMKVITIKGFHKEKIVVPFSMALDWCATNTSNDMIPMINLFVSDLQGTGGRTPKIFVTCWASAGDDFEFDVLQDAVSRTEVIEAQMHVGEEFQSGGFETLPGLKPCPSTFKYGTNPRYVENLMFRLGERPVYSNSRTLDSDNPLPAKTGIYDYLASCYLFNSGTVRWKGTFYRSTNSLQTLGFTGMEITPIDLFGSLPDEDYSWGSGSVVIDPTKTPVIDFLFPYKSYMEVDLNARAAGGDFSALFSVDETDFHYFNDNSASSPGFNKFICGGPDFQVFFLMPVPDRGSWPWNIGIPPSMKIDKRGCALRWYSRMSDKKIHAMVDSLSLEKLHEVFPDPLDDAILWLKIDRLREASKKQTEREERKRLVFEKRVESLKATYSNRLVPDTSRKNRKINNK